MPASIRSLPEPLRSGGFSEVGASSLTGGWRLPSQQLVGLAGSGSGLLGSGGSAGRLSDPLRPSSSSIRVPNLPAGVLPTFHQGSRLKPGASEPAPQSPGFYSRLFLVKKASGSWRPIIDLSTLNLFITSSRFHMETPRSVLNSIHPGDWMISLDLQDAYLQVPVHHDSRRFLRFVLDGKPFQFRVLCFSLTTAPQVFTRIMAPVSAILHRHGVRMLRYLDDWLILASSEIACLQSRDRLLAVCTELGIQVNLTKSSLVPSQSIVYLGMEILSLPFHCSSHTNTGRQPYPSNRGVPVNLVSSSVPLASPSRPPIFPDSSRPRRDDQDETSPTLSQGPVGLSGRPVPGLLVPSLQRGSSLVVEAGSAEGGRESLSSSSRHQLLLGRFRRGLRSPSGRAPRLSGLWLPHQNALSINMRELLAVQLGLQAFEHLIVGMSVALFCDNTTTVAYLRRSGGTFSSTLNSTAREVLLWAENRHICLLPQFIMGSSKVNADALSRLNQVIGSEWTLHQEVVDQLVHRWPAVIDLFATALTARLPVYFSPASDPRAAGTDALLQPWDDLQAYAFPPIAIIRRVLLKLRSSKNCELTLIAPFWPQRDWFPDLLELLSDVPITLSDRRDLLRQPHFHRFHQNLPMLRLTAWRLSSGSPSKPVSLLRWLDNLSSVEDCPPA